jgi:hypothetical protein
MQFYYYSLQYALINVLNSATNTAAYTTSMAAQSNYIQCRHHIHILVDHNR